MKTDLLKPSLKILTALGSIAIHVEEAMSGNGHNFDVIAIKTLLHDADLRQWIKDMGALMPVKR